MLGGMARNFFLPSKLLPAAVVPTGVIENQLRRPRRAHRVPRFAGQFVLLRHLFGFTALFCFVAALAAPLRSLAAASECTGTGSADRTLSPYFWVKPSTATAGSDAAAPEHADPLPLKSTRVEATIAGVFANVKVTQHYSNTGSVALEAVYIFPGSTRAAVHGLTLQVGDRRLEAKTKERGEARRTYEKARASGQTATLLEQQRPNVFQMNVANILPGDEIEVELRYTELLLPTAGVYEFVYPGVVGPRYSNRSLPPEDSDSRDTWVANPYLRKGEPDVADFSLQVSVAAGSPLRDVQCRSHKTHVDYSGPNAARIEINDTNAGNRDFILDYRLTGPAIQPGLLLGSGPEENFFMLTIQPPARPAASQMPAREYIFIVDVSGSMSGFPLSTARVLLENLLGTLRPIDSFNVLLFAGDDETFAPASVPATPENTAAALALLSRQAGGGATNLYPALKHALAMPQREEVSRSFIVVTDGYIDIEAEAFDLVRSNLGRANLFAFGIGSSVNRHLIEGLARSGLGEPFVVTDPGLAAETAKRFADYVGRPLLTRAAVKFDGLDAYDIEPRALPDLLADRPLVVFGKWRGRLGGKVTVEGVTGDGVYHSEHDVASAAQLPNAEGLARLWARARVAEQSDLNELKPTEETRAAITELGLKYNLLTRYTSFVAVDQPIRRVGPSLETIKQPVPLPAGVENSAVGGGSVAAAPEPGDIALFAVAALLLLIAWRKRQQSQARANPASTRLG